MVPLSNTCPLVMSYSRPQTPSRMSRHLANSLSGKTMHSPHMCRKSRLRGASEKKVLYFIDSFLAYGTCKCNGNIYEKIHYSVHILFRYILMWK